MPLGYTYVCGASDVIHWMVEQISSHSCLTVLISACKCPDSPYRLAAHTQGGPDANRRARGQQSGQTQESDSSQRSWSSGSTSSTASSELSDPDATLQFLRRSYGAGQPPVTAKTILAVSAGNSSTWKSESHNTCLSAQALFSSWHLTATLLFPTCLYATVCQTCTKCYL